MGRFPRLRPACPHCDFPLADRRPDDFIGAYTFNLILAELACAVVLVAGTLVLWPDPPWEVIQWAAAAGVVLTPVLLYPVSSALWFAIELVANPEQALARAGRPGAEGAPDAAARDQSATKPRTRSQPRA